MNMEYRTMFLVKVNNGFIVSGPDGYYVAAQGNLPQVVTTAAASIKRDSPDLGVQEIAPSAAHAPQHAVAPPPLLHVHSATGMRCESGRPVDMVR